MEVSTQYTAMDSQEIWPSVRLSLAMVLAQRYIVWRWSTAPRTENGHHTAACPAYLHMQLITATAVLQTLMQTMTSA